MVARTCFLCGSWGFGGRKDKSGRYLSNDTRGGETNLEACERLSKLYIFLEDRETLVEENLEIKGSEVRPSKTHRISALRRATGSGTKDGRAISSNGRGFSK